MWNKSLQPTCIYCERTNQQAPLITFQFKDQQYWICPQHLPILIHKPAELAGKLPGIEQVQIPDVDHP